MVRNRMEDSGTVAIGSKTAEIVHGLLKIVDSEDEVKRIYMTESEAERLYMLLKTRFGRRR